MFPPDLPPDAIPRSARQLRARLKRAWLNQGREIPKGFNQWPRRRLMAAWLKTIQLANPGAEIGLVGR